MTNTKMVVYTFDPKPVMSEERMQALKNYERTTELLRRANVLLEAEKINPRRTDASLIVAKKAWSDAYDANSDAQDVFYQTK